MLFQEYYWYYHVLGGALIGISSVFLMFSIGKIAGVSGILSNSLKGAFSPHSEWFWQLAFIAGLIIPGMVILIEKGVLSAQITSNPIILIIAGLLVGVGARVGNGCTSGHGICGIGRLSVRSIVATIIFMLSATVTIYITRHLFVIL